MLYIALVITSCQMMSYSDIALQIEQFAFISIVSCFSSLFPGATMKFWSTCLRVVIV